MYPAYSRRFFSGLDWEVEMPKTLWRMHFGVCRRTETIRALGLITLHFQPITRPEPRPKCAGPDDAIPPGLSDGEVKSAFALSSDCDR